MAQVRAPVLGANLGHLSEWSAVTSTEILLAYSKQVTQGLHRYYGTGYLHFITTSCYRRLPLLGSAKARDLFVAVLEQVRRRYHFVVVGFVVMPEHVHLLISEPERGNPSTVMQVVKQSFARRLLRWHRARVDGRQGTLWDLALDLGHVWQRRFYDFVVWKERKRMEKLRYMHRNPLTRGLVLEPEQWRWSSYRHYAYGESGVVLVNELQRAELKIAPTAVAPTLRKSRRVDWIRAKASANQ